MDLTPEQQSALDAAAAVTASEQAKGYQSQQVARQDSLYSPPEEIQPQESSISPSVQREFGYAPATQEKPDFSYKSPPIEQQYQQAIDYNRSEEGQRAIARGDVSKQDFENVQTKLDVLKQAKDVEDSYKDAGIEIPSDVKTSIDQARAQASSAFVTLSKTSSGELQSQIDIHSAVRAGTGESALRRLGIDSEAIKGAKSYWEQVDSQRQQTGDQVRALESLSAYKSDKGYLIDQAIQEGHLDLVKKAGFTPSDINAAQGRIGQTQPLPYLSSK